MVTNHLQLHAERTSLPLLSCLELYFAHRADLSDLLSWAPGCMFCLPCSSQTHHYKPNPINISPHVQLVFKFQAAPQQIGQKVFSFLSEWSAKATFDYCDGKEFYSPFIHPLLWLSSIHPLKKKGGHANRFCTRFSWIEQIKTIRMKAFCQLTLSEIPWNGAVVIHCYLT